MSSPQLKILFIIARAITAIMLMVALVKLPYGYYSFLRLIAFTCFGIAMAYFYRRNVYFLVIFAFLALLYNPFIPVHLSKALWAPINIASVVLIALSFFSRK